MSCVACHCRGSEDTLETYPHSMLGCQDNRERIACLQSKHKEISTNETMHILEFSSWMVSPGVDYLICASASKIKQHILDLDKSFSIS